MPWFSTGSRAICARRNQWRAEVTPELFGSVLEEELAKIQSWVGQERYKKGKYGEAAELFDRVTTSDQFAEFLTLAGYERLD
jgi:malate synthase